MFSHLKKHEVILVTGPQRSGTRICAKMIAHDTGHEYVDENEIHTDSMYSLMQVVKYQREGPVVVQCPALCHEMGFLHNHFIVMMKRSVRDIIASQKRIGWAWEYLEYMRYDDWWGQFGSVDIPIADLKYKHWNWLKRCIGNWEEVEYESLSEHPLWVPKEEREGFDAWQTKKTGS